LGKVLAIVFGVVFLLAGVWAIVAFGLVWLASGVNAG
jgi:hypothetical protein